MADYGVSTIRDAVTSMLMEVMRGRGGYGAFRCAFESARYMNEGEEPYVLARRIGYEVSRGAEPFVQLSAEQAAGALAFFAGDSIYMSHRQTPPKALTDIFAAGVAAFGPKARFFSNGRWDERARRDSFSWNGLSDATFDGGVIGLNDEMAFIVWVEEED